MWKLEEGDVEDEADFQILFRSSLRDESYRR